jgi:hypothetical protein
MKLRLSLAGLTVAAACIAAQSAPAAGSPVTLIDPPLDATGKAPDITSTVVTSDDSGLVRFRINIANQERLASDSKLFLYIDSDRNAATGSPDAQGAEFQLIVDGSVGMFSFSRWNGTSFMPSAWSGRVAWWSGATVTLNRLDIDGAAAFNFFVRTSQSSGAQEYADIAPTSGAWPYEVVPGGKLAPEVQSATAYMPAAPKAGYAFGIRRIALRLDNGQIVAPDSFTCTAKVGRSPLRRRGACTFAVPASARWKKLTLALTFRYRGSVIHSTHAATVLP